ncbi:DUF7668 domain-containing protein [Dyadobacter sp. BHUBP1]|uniref:DUF7668 domain-containing protein n=1 Tax=Dyadobacter sp. BHUBP1 TaxID=3424178 RepID=UPI003D32E046
MNRDKVAKILQEIVELLLKKKYDDLCNMSVVKRVTASMISEEINSYPGELTPPPDSSYTDFDVYPVDSSKSFIVDFFLWFDGEKSDLMINILFDESTPDLQFSVWDLLVP